MRTCVPPPPGRTSVKTASSLRQETSGHRLKNKIPPNKEKRTVVKEFKYKTKLFYLNIGKFGDTR